MVKIRLMRVGKKKQPSYRVVVADARSPRDGRIIEAIGHYNPLTQPSQIAIDTDRARYWLGRGAQPTDAVRKLIDLAVEGRIEVPGQPVAAPAATPAATPARSIKATPARSVDQVDADETPDEDEPPAAVPEATEQAAAAPDAAAPVAPEPEEAEPGS